MSERELYREDERSYWLGGEAMNRAMMAPKGPLIHRLKDRRVWTRSSSISFQEYSNNLKHAIIRML